MTATVLERPARARAAASSPGAGRRADGVYRVIVSATDALATVQEGGSDHRRHRRSEARAPLRREAHFRVSERSVVTLIVNGKRIVKIEKPGAFHVPFRGTVRTLRAVAADAAGNQSAPITAP